MKPLSSKVRRTYLAFLGALFLLALPSAILYATGYRIGEGFGLVQTGGVFISVPVSGAKVFINGEEQGTTGLLSRTLFVDDLEPGSYAVHVALEGHYPWYRTLMVSPQIVTDARAILVPEKLETVALARAGAFPVASTTRVLSRAEYDTYVSAFRLATGTPASLTQVAAAAASLKPLPPPEDERDRIALRINDGNLFAVWTRATSTAPSAFCVRPFSCTDTIPIEKGKEQVTYARFFRDGVLYATEEHGVFFAEPDIRATALRIPVYPRRGADFRIIDGALVVQDGDALYEIRGW